MGDVVVLIYNAGSGSWQTVEEISPDTFEQSWRVNALGALVASQRVIPAMKEKGSGGFKSEVQRCDDESVAAS